MTYAHTITLPLPFAETVSRVREALASQGFGILSEIDVHATFAAKLGDESAAALGDFLILGACNPSLSQRALTAEPEMGVLLPCNVVVRRGADATSTTVQTIDPQTMSELSTAPEVRAVADEADSRLRAALSVLEAG